jgi:hypothetical protein
MVTPGKKGRSRGGMSVTVDYYAVLGVSRTANADEIKLAYRRLARELHPDVNPDPAAQERFKQVTRAHQVLSDPDQRQMHDLGSDPFGTADGHFGQAPSERAQDGYATGPWESDREWWRLHPSQGAWNQSWNQAPYSDYLGRQPPSFSRDWRLPPRVMPYRRRPISVAIVFLCVVLAAAVVVAARLVTHRSDSLQATAVTTTETISLINSTWAPPRPGAAPAMTAMQAWLTWSHGMPVRPSVQLGLLTEPFEPAHCGTACAGLPVRNGIAYRALNQLAYGYFWRACVPPANDPYIKCWSWLFLNANTAAVITAGASNTPLVPGP